MGRTVSVDEMADAINELLEEYSDLATDGMKSAVQKSAKFVKEEISANAPKRTDAYAKSWTSNSDEGESSLDTFSLELFENIAFIMAYHADPQNTPHEPDEWLEQFNTFSIYQILPEIINLWGLNVQQQVDSKKNLIAVSGK